MGCLYDFENEDDFDFEEICPVMFDFKNYAENHIEHMLEYLHDFAEDEGLNETFNNLMEDGNACSIIFLLVENWVYLAQKYRKLVDKNEFSIKKDFDILDSIDQFMLSHTDDSLLEEFTATLDFKESNVYNVGCNYKLTGACVSFAFCEDLLDELDIQDKATGMWNFWLNKGE